MDEPQDLSGTLVSLSDKEIKTDADGRIVATGKAKDNRGLYAGIGAGGGRTPWRAQR